jgi:hypothetical protein
MQLAVVALVDMQVQVVMVLTTQCQPQLMQALQVQVVLRVADQLVFQATVAVTAAE